MWIKTLIHFYSLLLGLSPGILPTQTNVEIPQKAGNRSAPYPTCPTLENIFKESISFYIDYKFLCGLFKKIFASFRF